jgi:hypothetical protein
MLGKVRALLDLAEHPGTPAAEADLARQRADAIMAKYRIDINDLLGQKVLAEGVLAPKPVPFDIKIARNGPFVKYYAYLWGSVVTHVGVRSKGSWSYGEEPTWMGRGVGFDADVQYAEMLYTAARMAFSERLEPKVNPELSDQENIYRLRSAGIERVRIADIMWGNTDKVFLGRVGRMYKAECANRGEEPALSGRGVTGAAYREAYAENFVYEFERRLRAARSGGNGVALGNREDVLDEAFYDRFPNMRPKAAVEGGEWVDPRANCEKCQKAKNGACREHPWGSTRGPKGRDPYSAASMRGAGAGKTAARTVDLGRGSGTRQVGG